MDKILVNFLVLILLAVNVPAVAESSEATATITPPLDEKILDESITKTVNTKPVLSGGDFAVEPPAQNDLYSTCAHIKHARVRYHRHSGTGVIRFLKTTLCATVKVAAAAAYVTGAVAVGMAAGAAYSSSCYPYYGYYPCYGYRPYYGYRAYGY